MKALRKSGFKPDYAVPPGASLKETMESLGMTQRELAARTGLTVQTLNRIFKGSQPITCETAGKLELVTGIDANFWNSLEAHYRCELARLEEQERLAKDQEWLKTIPVAELVARRAIPHSTDKTIQLREVLKFYAVSDVQSWQRVWEQPAIAARRSTCFTSSPGPTSAWLRLGEIEAHKTKCAPYDKGRFQKALEEIRGLTNQSPDVFLPQMKKLCADAGVALVLVPEIKGAPWSGAAEWLSPEKALILLNLRGKSEDRFWFTFFHEASHILHDSKKEQHIDDGTSYPEDPTERRADEFAAERLIPGRHNVRIRTSKSADELRRIAEELGVSAGIVAGRYQYLTKRWTHFNGLKRRFQWAEQ